MAEIIVTEAQAGTTISASIGDLFVLRLPENPTTGYRWQVEATDLFLPLDDAFSAPPPAPGAAGERILRFRIVATGFGRLRLSLQREWEVSAAAQAHLEFRLQVR